MNYSIVFAVIAAMGAGWSYYRFFRGTGLLAGILLELVVGLAVLQFETPPQASKAAISERGNGL